VLAFATRSDSPPVYVHGHKTGSRIMRLDVGTGQVHQLAVVPGGHDATGAD
jgi:hypothetical protein